MKDEILLRNFICNIFCKNTYTAIDNLFKTCLFLLYLYAIGGDRIRYHAVQLQDELKSIGEFPPMVKRLSPYLHSTVFSLLSIMFLRNYFNE